MTLPAELSHKLAFLTGDFLIRPAITFGAALEDYAGSSDFGAHDFRNPAAKEFGPKREFDLLSQVLKSPHKTAKAVNSHR